MEQHKRDKILEHGETVAQILFLIYTILGFNSLTGGRKIVSVVMYLAYVTCAVVMLMRLFRWKRYAKTPGLVCLVMLCGICMVSIVMNRRYGLKRNVVGLIFWMVYFFLYFAQDTKAERELVIRRFRLAVHLVSGSAFLLAAISLGMMVMGYSKTVTVGTTQMIRGFAQGRLFGAYLNPNGGAFVAAAVMLLSLDAFRRDRRVWHRIFAGGNLLVQFFYLTFSDSRGGRLCLAAGLGTYVFLEIFRMGQKNHRRSRWAVALVLAALCVWAGWKAPKVAQNAYNTMISEISLQIAQKQDPSAPSGDALTAQEEEVRQQLLSAYQVKRGYDLSGDISNRRFDIWKSGLELAKRRPWYGLTFGGYLSFAEEEMPNTYVVSNNYRKVDTLENDFMNLLVSNGFVALGVFLVFVAWILIRVLRGIFTRTQLDPAVPGMMAICAVAAVFSMFNSSMLYSKCQVIPLFWLAVGSLTVLLPGKKGETRYE